MIEELARGGILGLRWLAIATNAKKGAQEGTPVMILVVVLQL